MLASSLFVKRKRISEMMLENVTTRRLGVVRHLDKSWKVIFVMYISCEQWCSVLSYFSFDYNLHCIGQGSQWVWDFTFINPGVIFTCILDNEFCFADAALKHPTIFIQITSGLGLPLASQNKCNTFPSKTVTLPLLLKVTVGGSVGKKEI